MKRYVVLAMLLTGMLLAACGSSGGGGNGGYRTQDQAGPAAAFVATLNVP